MKRFLYLLVMMTSLSAHAQFPINAGANTIDFSGLTGISFAPGGVAGGLDSDQWSVDIDGDGVIESGIRVNNADADELNFGGTQASTANFYINGTSTNQGSRGRMNVYNVGGGNLAVGFRPDGSPPGTNSEVQPSLTLKIENMSGSIISELTISYEIEHFIQNNGNTINLTFSDGKDNITYTPRPSIDFTANTSTSNAFSNSTRNITITDINIEQNESYFLRWSVSATQNANFAAAIDDIVITPTLVNPGNSSSLTAGPLSESTNFSSLTTTVGSVDHFDFILNDDGLDNSADVLPTRFNSIIIEQGVGNDVSNWTEVIASARLDDGTTQVTASSINATTLVFDSFANSSSGDFGFIDDNGSKTYTLSIALLNPLSGTQGLSIDNQNLVFEVTDLDFDYLGASSRVDPSEKEDSGSTNNAVDVTATELQFFSVPTSVGTGVDFTLIVLASDINGNADADNLSSISLTLNTGSGTLNRSGAGSLTQTLSSGSFTFVDLNYNTAENFSIDANGGGFPTINTGTIVASEAFRTRASGNWNSNTVWQINDGTGFVDAGTGIFPDQDDGPVNILNAHTVTINASLTVDQVTVESGGTINYTQNGFTINNDASGDDLIVQDGGRVNINDNNFNLNGTILVESGGLISTDESNLIDDLAGNNSGNVSYANLAIFEYTNSQRPPNDTYFPNSPAGTAPIMSLTDQQTNLNNFNSTINGILSQDKAGGVNISNSTLVVRNGFAGSGNLTLSSNVSVTGTSLYFSGTGTLDLQGQAIQPPTFASVFFLSDKTIIDGTVIISSNSTLDMGEFAVSDGGDNDLAFTVDNNSTVEIGNTAGVSGSFDAGAGLTFGDDLSFIFDGSSTQNTAFSGTGISSIFDLTTNNSNGITLDQTLIVSNDYNLMAGTFNLVTNNLNLMGNINGTGGSITSSTGNLVFDGISLQRLSGTVDVENIEINNSSTGLLLSGDLNVSGVVTFTNGLINSSAADILTMGTNASASGQSDASYVAGPMGKETNTTAQFLFPVGDANRLRPAGVTPTSTNLTVWTTEYFRTEQPFSTILGTDLDKISELEYWVIDRSGVTPANAQVTLTWTTGSGVVAPADLRVAKFESSIPEWENRGNASFSGTASSGSLTSTLTTNFSPFTLGTSTSVNPLPVELVHFQGNVNRNNIELEWTTASEENNEKFEVYRTEGSNIDDFVKIGELSGAGDSNTEVHYQFNDQNVSAGTDYFYRLKQIDFDGQSDYSSVINVRMENSLSLVIYPNPFTDEIEISGTGDVGIDRIRITDTSGKVHMNELLSPSAVATRINLKKLPVGMYVMELQRGKSDSIIRRLLKK